MDNEERNPTGICADTCIFSDEINNDVENRKIQAGGRRAKFQFHFEILGFRVDQDRSNKNPGLPI